MIITRRCWFSLLFRMFVFGRFLCFVVGSHCDQTLHDINHLLTLLHSLIVSFLTFLSLFEMTFVAWISHIFKNFQNLFWFWSLAWFSFFFGGFPSFELFSSRLSLKISVSEMGESLTSFSSFFDFSSFSHKAWFTSCFSPFSSLHVISSFGSVNKRKMN